MFYNNIFSKKIKTETNQECSQRFWFLPIVWAGYIQKKQTELYSESGKELDLFAYFLGQCQKVWRKRRRHERKKKNAFTRFYFLWVIILFSYLSSAILTRCLSWAFEDPVDFLPNPMRWAKSSNHTDKWLINIWKILSLCFCSNFFKSLMA